MTKAVFSIDIIGSKFGGPTSEDYYGYGQPRDVSTFDPTNAVNHLLLHWSTLSDEGCNKISARIIQMNPDGLYYRIDLMIRSKSDNSYVILSGT